jgi:hypothetical protein
MSLFHLCFLSTSISKSQDRETCTIGGQLAAQPAENIFSCDGLQINRNTAERAALMAAWIKALKQPSGSAQDRLCRDGLHEEAGLTVALTTC